MEEVKEGEQAAVEEEEVGHLVPVKCVSVAAVLEGAIANVCVNMTYVNPCDCPIECTYEFPLDKNTVVSMMSIQIGDKVIDAVVKEKEQAK